MNWGIALGGLGVGFVVGLTGMGGGALMTPMLVLLFGINPSVAVSSDLVASLVMKPVGSAVHLRHGTVNRPLVKWLVLGSVPSAFLVVALTSAFLKGQQLDDMLQTALGIALLLAAAGLVAKGAFRGRTGALGVPATITVRPLPTLAIGIFGGVVVGLTSVGSGSLMMVLLLVLYPALTSAQLVGTDLVQATPLVASAALAHMLFGHVEFALTGTVLIGALPGVYFGARVSSRAPDAIIRPALALVLFSSSVKLLGASNGILGIVLVASAIAYGVMVVRYVRHARAERSAGGVDEMGGGHREVVEHAPLELGIEPGLAHGGGHVAEPRIAFGFTDGEGDVPHA